VIGGCRLIGCSYRQSKKAEYYRRQGGFDKHVAFL
jgi:hypothetical protein